MNANRPDHDQIQDFQLFGQEHRRQEEEAKEYKPNKHRYRGYDITYNPKPIPARHSDWDYQHDDYDGAPDGGDDRAGSTSSIEQAKQEIDDLYFDQEPQNPGDWD